MIFYHLWFHGRCDPSSLGLLRSHMASSICCSAPNSALIAGNLKLPGHRMHSHMLQIGRGVDLDTCRPSQRLDPSRSGHWSDGHFLLEVWALKLLIVIPVDYGDSLAPFGGHHLMPGLLARQQSCIQT